MVKPTRPVAFFLANGALFGLLILGLALAVRVCHHKRASDLVGEWSWRAVANGFAIWLVVLTLATLADFALSPKGFSVTASSATLPFAVVALAGLAVQTFAEEYVFRGYVTQGLLLLTKRPMITSLLSGLLFGSMHIPNGWPQAAAAAVSGVVLAWLAIRTRSIAFTWGLHFANNSFAGIAVVSGGDVFKGAPGLFAQNTPHLQWWDMALGSLAYVLLGLVLARWPALTGFRTRATAG
jgi:membrane protease YdiL (CAAX protease family)